MKTVLVIELMKHINVHGLLREQHINVHGLLREVASISKLLESTATRYPPSKHKHYTANIVSNRRSQ